MSIARPNVTQATKAVVLEVQWPGSKFFGHDSALLSEKVGFRYWTPTPPAYRGGPISSNRARIRPKYWFRSSS